jgi:hypothetical protein
MNPLFPITAIATSLVLLNGCSLLEQPLSATSSGKTVPSPSTPKEPTSDLEKFVAARRLAWDAAVMVQNPPHPSSTWQEARVKWREAIRLLESIPEGSEIAVQAQEKLSVYRTNYAAIDNRLEDEQTAQANLTQAQTLAWQAAVTVQKPPHPLRVWQRASNKWQEAIALLEKVPATTSAFSSSQEKLTTYRENLVAINQRCAAEVQAMETLKQFSETVTLLDSIPSQAALNPAENNIGIGYSEYTGLVKSLEASLAKLSSQPDGKKHLIYPELQAAIADFNQVTQLWQKYLAYKQENAQWLYDDVFNQLFPLSLSEISPLVEKYGIKTYSGGTKISLRFTAWSAWYHARQQIRSAQQKVLTQS